MVGWRGQYIREANDSTLPDCYITQHLQRWLAILDSVYVLCVPSGFRKSIQIHGFIVGNPLLE